ncbi:TonB-dependent siderophore receptor [Pseudomonas aeruginosa]|uniref:TonB-dependent siderophore receptor n=1 Tax=Pseudomonas aeruginosa TaxID=287 RepID=UPI0009A37815|nr:TonB-dependent siderophore receptor [Pseudomonas aeruginosa]ELX8262539.1 TonB-dependent siderophore receptor [Pseudomonas aeruginosa]MBG4362183.1 TonB-dependent siderophore receptor [Pseudomonas aeruginosa]MBG6303433.1 TonB-dependent siderophore receptor [Pseudomonas aeruginosa]MBH4396562.1 TonB-dependent siderophore receptor [Pseudomonas aeruginosa]MBH8841458.1 TonB-dependent siderophore receptor [Pseudomonas aeruginosa]
MKQVQTRASQSSKHHPNVCPSDLLRRLALAVLTTASCNISLTSAEETGERQSSTEETPAALPELVITATTPADPDNGPVQGYVAEEARTGSKSATPLLEVPQSVSVVTREQMDVLQPASTSQALRYSAGASSERFGGFGTQLDITRIRGVDADYYLDGLRVISNVSTWTPQVDPYTLERVEVLRGPSSALYGQGTGGGIVNQISRRPRLDPAHEVSVQFGSFRRRELRFDSTGPLDDAGQFSYRITGTGLDTHGQVEDVRHERFYIAPALTWNISDEASWTLLATHSREPQIPDYNSLPAVALGLNGSRYPKVKRHRNFTDIDFQGSSRKQDSISSLFEYRFGEQWAFNSNLRYMYIDSDIQRTSIYGYQDRSGHLWLEGTYGLAPASSNTFQMDNSLSGVLALGPTTHRLLFGTDFAKGTLRSDSYRMDPVAFDPFDPEDYRPHADPDFSDSRTNWPYNVRQEFRRTGLYAQDQIAYRRWRLTLSGRYDRTRTDDTSRSYSPVWTSSHQEDQKWSGRIGLGYLFDNGLAPYASYSTAFDPVLGNDFHGKTFAPTEAKQYELGLKYHPDGSATFLGAALFQLNQTNVKTPDTQHLGYWTQSGEVRSRGLELQATTQPLHNLNLLANYTYLDNVLVKDASYQGKSLTQTPRHNANAWLDYRLDEGSLVGLQLGGGIRYLGSSWGNPRNTFKVPAATLLDLVMSYELAPLAHALDGASVALNVSNLTNREYVASCISEMYCFIGQDRVVTATLAYRW